MIPDAAPNDINTKYVYTVEQIIFSGQGNLLTIQEMKFL